ncbi:MAG: amidohydrolase family protein, partial [Bacteroidetes bacterium]|nr:amidohydrolase family protein [Bacteroidota bacterium]
MICPSFTSIALVGFLITSASPRLCGEALSPDTTKSAATDSTKKEDKWDVAASHGPSKDVEFDTDEGTWISVDVSPDGKKIVFDLLGDI